LTEGYRAAPRAWSLAAPITVVV